MLDAEREREQNSKCPPASASWKKMRQISRIFLKGLVVHAMNPGLVVLS
jgi:threonine/homoserine/homoserine lactone efflux protein